MYKRSPQAPPRSRGAIFPLRLGTRLSWSRFVSRWSSRRLLYTIAHIIKRRTSCLIVLI